MLHSQAARKPGKRYADVPEVSEEERRCHSTRPTRSFASSWRRSKRSTRSPADMAAAAFRPPPERHWRSYGTEPLPTPQEALDEPLKAFPSWFLKITCDRCGKDVMMNEVHAGRSR